MSPAAATWDRMDPEQRTAAVADLLAEGQAPGTIAFKLKAPKPAIQRLAAIVRQKELHQESQSGGDGVLPSPAILGASPAGRDSDESPATNTKGKPHGPIDRPEAHSRDRAGLPADSRAGDRQPHSEKRGGVRATEDAGVGCRLTDFVDLKNAPEVLVNDEPSPEVGPQAEASHCQDTGVGMPADREGCRDGEAASADLPTIPEKPATSSRSVTAPERATSSPSAPAAPSIPWTAMTFEQKADAVLALRAKGFSAGQIEVQLQATSRSAVLGVVNRARKAGRAPAAPGRSKAAITTKPPKSPQRRSSKALAHLPGGKPKTNQFDFRGRAADRAASQGLAPHLVSGEPRRPIVLEVPQSRRLQLVDLNDHVCRWPAGDPLTEGFSFCGNATEAAPYCQFHASIAYQSPAERRAEREQERTA